MQVEGQHAVGAGMGDQVGDELGRDRRARAGLAVLPRVAEIGQHRGDAPRRRAPQRVDDDQQFHQVIVRRIRGRLDHEHVGAAHVLQDLDEDLHIGKAPDHGLGERGAQVGGDRFGEARIGVAGDELDGSVSRPTSPSPSSGISRCTNPAAAAVITSAPATLAIRRTSVVPKVFVPEANCQCAAASATVSPRGRGRERMTRASAARVQAVPASAVRRRHAIRRGHQERGELVHASWAMRRSTWSSAAPQPRW